MHLDINHQFSFVYKAELDQGLTEHEFDHVFTGIYESEIKPNPEEVAAFKYISISDLKKDLNAHPEQYTEWFKIAFKQLDLQSVS